MIIKQSVEQAYYLFDCDTICFDIETETRGQGYWEGKDYGLSAVSPPTFISFYSADIKEEQDTVVVLDFNSEERDEIKDFIRHLFSQKEPRRWVAHNATFDFRHLGVHFNFEVPFSHDIWDTQILAIRTLLCQVKNEEYSSSLENQIRMFNLVEREHVNFLKHMKNSRGVLHTLPREQVVEYAALDSWYTYKLYVTQVGLIEQLKDTDLKGKFGNAILAIQQWPEIEELVNFELRISRWSANSAIRGVRLNLDFAEKRYTQWHEEKEAARKLVLDSAPPLPYEEFYDDLKMMIWWEHIVKYLSGEVSTFKNYFLFEEWDYHIFTDDLLCYMTFENEEQAEGWDMGKLRQLRFRLQALPPAQIRNMNWVFKNFAILDPAELCELHFWYAQVPWNNRFKKTKLRDGVELLYIESGGDPLVFSRGNYPTIDVKKFIKEKTGITEDYKVDLFYEWYEFLYRQRHKVDREDYLDKNKWKPFFFFVIAGVPIPTHEQVLYAFDSDLQIVTEKINNIISWLEPLELSVDSYNHENVSRYDPRQTPYPIPFDYSQIAQQHNSFSISKNAINYLLPDKDEEGNKIEYEGTLALAKAYELFLKNGAMMQRAEEFIAHTELDGRLHSMLRRGTNTGRFMASQPNLQNVKLRSNGDFDFIGFLQGDEGYTLVELDFSNAENKVAVLVSGDNLLAQATETGDFHRNMAMRYNNLASPERVTKDMRNRGKVLTFGTSYGMGKYKLRRTLGTVSFPVLPYEAQAMLDRKDQAFPQVTLIKERSSKVVEKRFKEGWVPYINVWSKARVIVSSFMKNGEKILQSYKAWNGAVQGGVGEAIARSCVLANEWLELNGYHSRIILNIHDSLIVHCLNEEYEIVIPKICEIMNSIIPDRYLQRTIPAVHMATGVGPENAFKWGFVEGQEYAFGYDTFINQWGVHSLPEDQLELPPEKREAPTWIGPEHLGWTLEAEVEKQKELIYEPIVAGST